MEENKLSSVLQSLIRMKKIGEFLGLLTTFTRVLTPDATATRSSKESARFRC
jgi:hypothetical protein